MQDNIFDQIQEGNQFDKVHVVDLKKTMETCYICLLYTSDAADD